MLETGQISKGFVRVFAEGYRGVTIYREFEQYWTVEGEHIVREVRYRVKHPSRRWRTLDEVRAFIDKKLEKEELED